MAACLAEPGGRTTSPSSPNSTLTRSRGKLPLLVADPHGSAAGKSARPDLAGWKATPFPSAAVAPDRKVARISMNTVTPLTSALDQRVRQAMAAALPVEAADADPQIRASDHADFQANGVLPLAKPLRANPRELATKVAAGLADDDLIANCEVSGPGFLHLTIADQAIWKQLDSRRGDARLGIPATETGTAPAI